MGFDFAIRRGFWCQWFFACAQNDKVQRSVSAQMQGLYKDFILPKIGALFWIPRAQKQRARNDKAK